MKILVRGKDHQIEEFKSKFPIEDDLQFDETNTWEKSISEFDMVFDFFIDESPENLDQYNGNGDLIVFCNSVKSSLAEYSYYLDHIIGSQRRANLLNNFMIFFL